MPGRISCSPQIILCAFKGRLWYAILLLIPKLNSLAHLLLTTLDLWLDVLRFIRLSLQPNWALAPENLFLCKELALYLERKVKPRPASDATRLTLVLLS